MLKDLCVKMVAKCNAVNLSGVSYTKYVHGYEIIHPLLSISNREEGYRYLLCYCFMHMYGYAMECYEREREGITNGKFGVI